MAADSIGLEIKLGATQIGMDEKGKFAVLEKREQLESDGSLVKIEPYSEEPFPGTHVALSGLEISVAMVASDKAIQTAESIRRLNNVNPTKVNLTVPNEWSFSVYFDRVGNVNSSGLYGLKLEK